MTKKEYDKKRYQENRDRLLLQAKQWYQNNKERVYQQHKEYREEHREYYKEYNREWEQKNKQKRKIQRQKYRKKTQEQCNKYQRYKRNVDPQFCLNRYISSAISIALKGIKNGRHWEDLVGYTVNDLMKHLESLFEPWMNWDNYGKWHLDHIRPKSWFKYENPKDEGFKECWALKNLQPLEAKENLIKNNRYEGK